MVAPQYTYLIADTRTNTVLEEVPLDGVSFTKPLNDSGSFRGRWHLGRGSSALDPYRLTTPCKRAVYALRDGRPMWGGVIWSRDYDSTSRTVSLGAGEFWSYFDHRKVIPPLGSSPGLYTVAEQTVSFTNTDQNEIARQLVAEAQRHTAGDIGVELDGSLSYVDRDRTYHGYDLADTGEALRNLAEVHDGPDMVFDVLPPAGGSAAPRRVLRLGTPYLGQQGSAHVWEVGGNATGYRWKSDGTQMRTRAFASGEGVDLGTPIAVYEDTSRYDAGYVLLESESTYSGAERAATLNGHARADYEAGRAPVALVEVDVRGDIPPTAAEVDRGDDGRLVLPGDEFHPDGWAGPVRVVEARFEPSASAERVALTMAPLLEDAA